MTDEEQKAADDAAAAAAAAEAAAEPGIPAYHAMRLPADVVAAAGLRNGMSAADVDVAVNRVLNGKLP